MPCHGAGGHRYLRTVLLASCLHLPVAAPDVLAARYGESFRNFEYEHRWLMARTLHRVIDDFLARYLCRLDHGELCNTGRDGQPFEAGIITEATNKTGAWAVSGHSGESERVTTLLFDAAFKRAPRRICEVGFNVGHSAVTLLAAAGRNASYLGFDLPILNPQVNLEFFDMITAWFGEGRSLEMRWGDARDTVPRYLVETRTDEVVKPACELTFYDGPHDVVSVLKLLPLLRQLSASSRSIILVDDVRCAMPVCNHSALAWDFLAWAGFLREISCVSDDGPEPVYGACLGEFLRGPSAIRCSRFDTRCVAATYDVPARGGLRETEWQKCCL